MPMQDEHTDHSLVPTLAELITRQRRIHGFTYRELEVRADSVISHQRWQQLGTNSRVKEFTEPATILAMAQALDVDVTTVVLATAKSVGLPVESGLGVSELARSLPASARELDGDQRDAIISLIGTMARSTKGGAAKRRRWNPGTRDDAPDL